MFENCHYLPENARFANCIIIRIALFAKYTAVFPYLPLKCSGELVSLKINKYKCGYCGACVGVCPKGALELVETWVEVDESTCISCGVCDRVCPVGAIEVVK
jgi:NAD-dependent dihydropyrimidine dehydrogenase PreA subunit